MGAHTTSGSRRVINAREYKLWGGGGVGWGDNITATIRELESLGVIRPAQGPLDSLVWPLKQ